MRIVVAPDKFKGSLDATEVVENLSVGIKSVKPYATVVAVPVADGGEGTLEAAVGAGFAPVSMYVTGPMGDAVEASFALLEETAVIEMALASGIAALPVDRDGTPILDAGRTTSRGTGELIRGALEAGATRVILGVGGSACTDGGAGMLQGLGARLLDQDGNDLDNGGSSLTRLARVDLTGLEPLLRTAEFVLAADVDNPLTGPEGAAAVFGPQKGASPELVSVLDSGLTIFRDRLVESIGPAALDAATAPGAGAAGGVGFAALAVLAAKRRPGIDVVLEFVGLAELIAGAALVITGEGSLDEQSLGGKTPLGVARSAHAARVPVVAVCGRTTLKPGILRQAGFLRTYTLSELEPDPRLSMQDAARLLQRVGASIAEELSVLLRFGPSKMDTLRTSGLDKRGTSR